MENVFKDVPVESSTFVGENRELDTLEKCLSESVSPDYSVVSHGTANTRVVTYFL